MLVAIWKWFDKQVQSSFPSGGSEGCLELSGETAYHFLSQQTVVRTTAVMATCPKDSATLPFFLEHLTVSCLSTPKIREQSELVNSITTLGQLWKVQAVLASTKPVARQGKDCLSPQGDELTVTGWCIGKASRHFSLRARGSLSPGGLCRQELQKDYPFERDLRNRSSSLMLHGELQNLVVLFFN